ncbi:MAG: hypothetical protein LBR56_02500 [Sporomusaceae bacterium]|nr:hypothetical protein [Sporomusaceae bacterium]
MRNSQEDYLAAFPKIKRRQNQKGDCSYCRYGIVKAMKYCGILPDNILEECLYDSYDATRKMAKRLKK